MAILSASLINFYPFVLYMKRIFRLIDKLMEIFYNVFMTQCLYEIPSLWRSLLCNAARTGISKLVLQRSALKSEQFSPDELWQGKYDAFSSAPGSRMNVIWARAPSSFLAASCFSLHATIVAAPSSLLASGERKAGATSRRIIEPTDFYLDSATSIPRR